MLTQKIIFGLLVALFLCARFTRAQEEDDSSSSDSEDPSEGQRSCYKYTFDFLQSSLLTGLKCLGEKFQPKNLAEYVTRSYCILKCILQELGTIDKDGKFDDIAAAFFFEENFADEVKNGLLPNVQGCFALAEQFDPKDYYCKTYQPFISCVVKALLNELGPFIVRCFGNPVIALFLDFLKNWTPDPIIQNDVRELQRAYMQKKAIKCYNKSCTQKYKIEKTGNTTMFVLYDGNMTEISRTPKKTSQGANIF